MTKGYFKEMTDVKKLVDIEEVRQRDDRCQQI